MEIVSARHITNKNQIGNRSVVEFFDGLDYLEDLELIELGIKVGGASLTVFHGFLGDNAQGIILGPIEFHFDELTMRCPPEYREFFEWYRMITKDRMDYSELQPSIGDPARLVGVVQ